MTKKKFKIIIIKNIKFFTQSYLKNMSLKAQISDDETFEKIKTGFKINLIQMKDGETGKMIWDCKNLDLSSPHLTIKISKELLKCKVIKRNVNFSSVDLNLVLLFLILLMIGNKLLKLKKKVFYLLKSYLGN